jgi:tRNA(adenine34) deaminase
VIEPFNDEYFMRQAYNEACKAAENNEVPVGAVITYKNRIIARSANEVERLSDVTAHAEILVITAAAHAIGSKYLHDCKIYVTLEPCIMCAGALAWSQISGLFYGTEDEKNGFMRVGRQLLHPSTTVEFGLLRDECSELLTSFFSERRKNLIL